MTKTRLDVFLVEQGYVSCREQARGRIMAGEVLVDGIKADKAGFPVRDDAQIELLGDALPFVSRGGLKLQKALDVFPINLGGRVAVDIGASTGGFTDCMLQHGASKVYAVDVGYGQLDWKLRSDERVVVMERSNARFMEPAWFTGGKPSFATIDVSFISLGLILPPLLSCLTSDGEVIALIKPQFEAGRSEVGKHGVVRDELVHSRVCAKIVDLAYSLGYAARGLDYSPITGPKGNIEFLLWLGLGKASQMTAIDIPSIVHKAHEK